MKKQDKTNEDIKKQVRQGYAEIADGGSCCAPTAKTCSCNSQPQAVSESVGYSVEELRSIPKDAVMGLGCGNPVALASLKDGEVVLDLGSGGGIDCFLAANRVGSGGRVIGVDMTPEMLDKARGNAAKAGYKNVEFRLGEIENIPAADCSVDVVVSNCVINLSPDKDRVFREAFRVLRPGGRLMVSDIVLTQELPDCVRKSVSAYVGCIAGAIMKQDYLAMVAGAGFVDVEVLEEARFSIDGLECGPDAKAAINKLNVSPEEAASAAASVLSAKVRAIKPI